MKKMLGALVVLLLCLFSLPAFAHEGREVGEYVIEFGWRVEPAYVGLLNGPEFTIENHDTDEGVQGLESTLQLRVLFGDQSKLLSVYPVFDNPGHYTADLLPTRPGDYSFQLSGSIGEQEVDETFTSADGEFSSIEPATDIMFPAPENDIEALEAQIAELVARIDALTGD
ncbi:MAG: hypothetical protein ABI835_09090 [Chloroflexota bacterium]